VSYILRELLAAAGNHGGSRTAGKIKYLVIHYTGNDGDSAASNARYFHSNVVKTSAHYFVDGKEIWRSVPDLVTAYAVGGEKYASAEQTGGGTMHGIITNTNSLSVELCDPVWGGGILPSEAVLENAAALCRQLMEQYSIPLENVYRHFDVSGKLCPAYFVDAKAWAEFKDRLEGTMDISKLSDEQVLQLANRMQYLLGKSLVSNTLRPELNEARELGITDGSSPNAFCTRAQAAVMVKRGMREAVETKE